jgi:hypothetical protein
VIVPGEAFGGIHVTILVVLSFPERIADEEEIA